MKHRAIVSGALAAALLGLSAAALAQPRQRPDGAPRQPPPEAFSACANHREGDPCAVAIFGRTIEGTCAAFLPQPQRSLVCRPNQMPGGPPPR
jgi:hypothetical protein